MNTTMKANTTKEKSFDERLKEMHDIYNSIVNYLRANKMEYGTYLLKHENGNWLFYCDANGNGFIGEPMDEFDARTMQEFGWGVYEFRNIDKTCDDYEFYGWEPMTYNNMGSFIKKVKAVI